MNVLITGATGFVGKNLLAYFFNRKVKTIPVPREKMLDIFNSEICNATAVVHLAGKAHDLRKYSNPEEYYKVNFELTKVLYNSFLNSNAEKFIFISSVKAVADSINGILTEEVTPLPETDYGKSKLMAEQYIQLLDLPVGKSFYILRPCMIHGPGNKGNLNLLYQFVSKRIPYFLSGFENKRSFLSIENLCFVINELLQKNIPSGIYNVADDDPLSTNEVVSILAQSLNRKASLLGVSPSLLRFLAKIGDRMSLPLNTERLNKLTENYLVSNKKIKEAINVRLPMNAVDGLLLTANSFKKGNSIKKQM